MLPYLLKIFIISLVCGYAFTMMLAEDPRDFKSGMTACIVNAAHIVDGLKVAIEFEKSREAIASEIIKQLNLSVILNLEERRVIYGIEKRPFDNLIILLKDVEPEKFLHRVLWNTDTRFLLITENKLKMEQYFKDFWKLRVVNLFALVLDEEDNLLYSFLPYKANDCDNIEIITVGKCIEGNLQGADSALTNPFRVRNLNGCPVNITVTDIKPSIMFERDGIRNSTKMKGYEGQLIMEVGRVYNFTTTFKLADDGLGWGWIHPTPAGTIGEVYRGISDMALALLAAKYERYQFLDLSIPYYIDECATFALPRGLGHKRASWIRLFLMEFTFSAWILILFSFLIAGINMWVINRYLRVNWLNSKTQIIMFLFSSYLGNPIKLPHFTSGRISVLFWMVFSFIVTVAYKGSMGSRLAVPPRDGDIETATELLDSDLTLSGIKNMYQTLEGEKEHLHELRLRYRPTLNNIEWAVDRIAEGDKLAYLQHKSAFLYYQLINPKARGRVQVLKYCCFPYQPRTVLRRYSHFTLKVSDTICRLEESGIMSMWRAEYVKLIPPPKKPFFKLSMKQMVGIFCFLAFGHVFALFSFIWELLLFYGVPKPQRLLRYLRLKF